MTDLEANMLQKVLRALRALDKGTPLDQLDMAFYIEIVATLLMRHGFVATEDA